MRFDRQLVAEFATFLGHALNVENDPTDVGGSRRWLAEHEERCISQLAPQRRTASGLGEAVPSDGGFMLGSQVADQIVFRAYEESTVLSRCVEWELDTPNTQDLKIPTFSETSRVDGSRWGGLRSYWVNEADQATSSKPKFSLSTLTPKKQIVLVHLTDELLNDMGALAQYLLIALGKEVAFKTTDGVVAGDGSGKPQGILYSPAKITVDKVGGQSSATVVSRNITDMKARFWVGSRQRSTPAWFCNSDVEAVLPTMTVTVGAAGSLSYLYDHATGKMLGYPVIPIEQCNALGTEGDLILADMMEYWIAWRDRGSLFSSMHLKFLTDESTIRLTVRVDGQGSWGSAVTPLHGTSTQSPFVTLQTR